MTMFALLYGANKRNKDITRKKVTKKRILSRSKEIRWHQIGVANRDKS